MKSNGEEGVIYLWGMRELKDIYFVYMVVMWGVSLSRSGENHEDGEFWGIMPSSHLPRMVSDKFVYDFFCAIFLAS